MSDSCNAVGKERGKLRICERPLKHDGQHLDGAYEWGDESIDGEKHVIGGRTGQRESQP